ncbi:MULTISPECIES: ligase-associated DNA damage response exonuclease [unclassified Beijerinckia]|uniref:ligase-associated DNA damage response exonuclease n=1 Tax=unclassified Beijerinckia TaxID=2638183 RepID=UPI000899C217|nr:MULTISPECIES: ligase-associated DNA damage response exonuclease [unclassified Beijerinckia]MDH7797351.1 putative mRNA 3-end processing factor [Beijerinckia sp. GAS462]SEC82113.1 putative mRNA 3-end processing factor [Beijerinckia sp. 28-YEA-48]
MASSLLVSAPEGLYCPAGDFFVDPVRPVRRALITHGHSDHARAGHGAVLATVETLSIMALRYGAQFADTQQAVRLGEVLRLDDAEVSFHPAGHVLGSAQIAIAKGRERIVVSGDYKRAADPTCLPFEVVPCDIFITEATFGLPIFHHPEAREEVGKLIASLRLFPERTHMIGAYSLGKAQRLMALIRQAGWERPIYIHGAVEKITDFYIKHVIDLGEIRKVADMGKDKLPGEIVICPPSSLADTWSRRFADPVSCFASGWMRTRARARQRGVELPLVISDHADWSELTRTIMETGCREVWVTHGEGDALVHWAQTQGLSAMPLHMLGYGDEEEGVDQAPEPAAEKPAPAAEKP